MGKHDLGEFQIKILGPRHWSSRLPEEGSREQLLSSAGQMRDPVQGSKRHGGKMGQE